MKAQRQEPPWAAQVVLSVTGLPKSERAAIQELVERAGGRYSPTLSRRCTHLAVPSGVSDRSEKLHSALRNQHKWGLHIVDLRWVLESAGSGQRLAEAEFPVHPLPQEQAAPSAVTRRSSASWAGTGDASDQAADTYRHQQRSGCHVAGSVAATASAARPVNPLRNSVNSRPLSSFAGGQSAPSLRTQALSASYSVRWQVSESSPTQLGPSSGGAAAAAAHAAAAAVLPGQVEQRCLIRQEADDNADLSKLPMTQAGFLPAADLLEKLRASSAGLLCAEPPPHPVQPPQLQHSPQPQLPQQEPQAEAQQQHGRPAGWQQSGAPMQQLSMPRYAGQGSPEQPGLSSTNLIDPPLPPISPQAMPSAAAQQVAAVARSTSDLLQQLRLSITGPPLRQQAQQAPQQPQQQARDKLSTAELLGLLRQPPPEPLQAVGASALHPGEQQHQQHQQQHVTPTDVLVQQLRSSMGEAQPQQAAQQTAQQAQQAHGRLATEDLLAALRAAPAAGPAGHQQLQVEGLHVSAAHPQQPRKQPQQQPQQQAAAPATADLLRQLQAASAPAASTSQTAMQPALSTAELLEQLRASADVCSTSGKLPTRHTQQGAASGVVGKEAGLPSSSGQRDVHSLLQQLQQVPPAAATPPQQPGHSPAVHVPVVHAEVAAAAASRLADQMRSLLQESGPVACLDASVAAAAGEQLVPGGRSTEELLALLRQQHEQQCDLIAPAAANPVAAGDSDELLAKLQSLPLPQPDFTPLRLQAAAAAQAQLPLAVGLQQAPRAARWPADKEEEMPPAKYQRQHEPQGSAAAAAQQTRTAPPATPAGEVGVAADGSGSLAPTAVVSGGHVEAASPPSGPVPASSAGSPPAAVADADSLLPAGSGEPEAASSQVAESNHVFGAMVAIVAPSLPAEEQQRIAAALEQGGGRVAAGSSLTRGVTHVVCQPDQALHWLSMGVGIVSPAWVLQSLRAGKQQRCLMVSADASRHLPAASASASRSSQQPGYGEAASGGSSSAEALGQQLSSELLASKEARQQALLQLAGKGTPAVASTEGRSPSSAGPLAPSGHRQAATPAALLVGVLWSVVDPPSTAQLEARSQPRAAQDEEGTLVIPDSEEEEEDHEQARVCCISASQAAVADVLCEAAGAIQPEGGRGLAAPKTAAAEWQQDVVLQGPATITMLLPRDARGELGSDTRSFSVPAGRQGSKELTAAQLLSFVHAYYAEELAPAEQLSLLQTYPAAAGASAVLRPAFLELAALPRGALLGPRCAFEGLRKATRDPAGAVYEVLLGS